jgi:glycosyltransferase involved in cell wall biosynthesis
MLSIIIPTYNEAKYLPLLLQSIKLQSFIDYEVIIADNNSTDSTVEIAKTYGAQITSGGLPGTGRNEGAKIAKGDLLLFLDADVILIDKNYLTDCYAEFSNRNVDVATCCIFPISTLKKDIIWHQFYNAIIIASQKFSPYAPGFCIFAKKSVHDSINGFDEDILLGEDSDYVKRANKISTFKVLRSQKIHVSVRRLDKDGRINVIAKYAMAGLYMMIVGGIKTNIFNYSFGNYDKKK